MITAGAVYSISQGVTVETPIVQVLEVRKITVATQPGTAPAGERYKLKISDGEHFMQAMLTTNHNHLVQSEQLQENGLIQLDEYVCNTVQDRKICIIVNLTVVAPATHYGRAGNPVAVETVSTMVPVPVQAPVPVPTPTPVMKTYQAPQVNPSVASYTGGARPYSGVTVATSSETPRYVPVASLNPYSSKWTIKVRVTGKGDKRSWSNARGEGSLFSCDLLDDKSTPIRATFFRDGVDKFFDVIQKGGTYYMSGGKLKAADKRFSSIKNDYEITFDGHATIVPAPDDTNIKHMQYSFVSIAGIESVPKDTTVDVIGILKDVGAASNFTSKAGRELTKRDVTIVDRSSTTITMTLWGEKTGVVTEGDVGGVLAVKGARVGDFGGRSLSTSNSSDIAVNPDIPEAAALRTWWDTEGATQPLNSLSGQGGGGGGGGNGPANNAAARKCVSAVRVENMGGNGGDQGDVFTSKATVIYIKSDSDKAPWYPACVKQECNKKAIQNMSGDGWHCEKCGVDFPQPNYRYILSTTVADHTGSEWVTLFNTDAALLLNGHTADEMHVVKEAGEAGVAQWNAVFQEANFKQFMFRLKAKKEPVNDQLRLKVTAFNIRPIEYGKECRVLLDAIKQYDAKA